MRNRTEITIEGYGKIEIKELTIKEILSLFDNDIFGDGSIENLRLALEDKVLPLCTDIKFDALQDFAPSELKQVWDKFMEVNSVFFDVAQKMGLSEIIEKIKEKIREDFGKLYVELSKQDT